MKRFSRQKKASRYGSHLEAIEPRLLMSSTLVQIKPTLDPIYFSHSKTSQWASASKISTAAYAGSSTPYGLTPQQVRSAYGVDITTLEGVSGNGSGTTIAIVDAYDDPNALGDLEAFDSAFSLPNPPSFEKVNDQGQTTNLPGTDPSGPYSSTGGSTWEQEESLDIEWAHVIAPDANIVLVEAKNANDLYTAVSAARNMSGVDVVSMSWGGNEFSGETTDDSSYFSTPAGHTGITFVASAGDSGAYSSGGRTITPQYPAASPNVLAVGGTDLTVSGDSYVSESGWGNSTSSGTSGGGGGGISKYESQPSYQSGVVTQSTTKRTYPDVAMDADPSSGVPIYDSWDFGASTPWLQGYEGGTSLAAPLWAGMISIADQGLIGANQGTLTNATAMQKLYHLSSSDFHDVTTGNNGYAAGAGYDLVTGLGTPVANKLIPDLAGVSSTAATVFTDAGSGDTYSVEVSPTNSAQVQVFVNGAASSTVALNSSTPLTVNFTGANQTLVVDAANGNPIPAGGIVFNAASVASNDTLEVLGSTGDDSITVNTNAVTFGTSNITLSNVANLLVDPRGGSDTLAVNAGTVTIPAQSGAGILSRQFADLSVGAGATLDVATPSDHADRAVLVADDLAVDATAHLDLGGNDLVVHNGNLAGLTALLQSGFAGGAWNGEGISSAAAHADATSLTALGIILNQTNAGAALYQSFDGQLVSTSDVLIKYTYYGDTDLNGKVNGDDYTRTDTGDALGLSGWLHGDFNYSGSVGDADYSLIDSAYGQSAVM